MSLGFLHRTNKIQAGIVTLDIEALVVPWKKFAYSLLLPDGRLAIQPVRGTQRAQILRYCKCLVTIWYASARDMFTIDRNKSLVNFTGSDVLRLQKPNHASHLTVGGGWYQRVHCLNLSHSQRGKVCSTNCTKQLSTLYWTYHMTHQLKLNNCAGCMRKRSLLSRCPTYMRCISDFSADESHSVGSSERRHAARLI